ncbi:uncharacterized protein [Phyllobates terribilis]|uniref:uncharacterized protein n=1 Tax=Phyllobates terribilis TaxID=111132 RepID=UPI003CCB424F
MDVDEEKGGTCEDNVRLSDVSQPINSEEFGSNSPNKLDVVLQGSKEKITIQSSVDEEKISDENVLMDAEGDLIGLELSITEIDDQSKFGNVKGITRTVALIPNLLVSGSVVAAKLAIECRWAINLGGGFHHCSAESGGGFCAYADVSLIIRFALVHFNISRVMIIDLDAHQGNDHERDFSTDGRVYILGMFNPEIYPFDYEAQKHINQKVEVCATSTNEYLKELDRSLEVAGRMCDPELILYNAGTNKYAYLDIILLLVTCSFIPLTLTCV